MEELFTLQVGKLRQEHFLILYWAATAEDQEVKYNITNVFDDLKQLRITRTKQSVVAYIESLEMLCFIELRDERNRKNIYITAAGAEALMKLTQLNAYKTRKSPYLSTLFNRA